MTLVPRYKLGLPYLLKAFKPAYLDIFSLHTYLLAKLAAQDLLVLSQAPCIAPRGWSSWSERFGVTGGLFFGCHFFFIIVLL